MESTNPWLQSSTSVGSPTTRHPLLLSRDRSALLVIDLQERLMPAIPARSQIVWNTSRLIRGAQILKIPTIGTEQVPEKLGATVAEIRESLPRTHSKQMFSCRECAEPLQQLRDLRLEQLVICGIETHVCILQSALDCLQQWPTVFVVVDAVGARNEHDQQYALRRMESCGCHLTTTESVLFEWCETAAADDFRAISQLVREAPPQ
jgi:nicotinamidase-related amidase